jgi:hypothetical protein
MKKPHPTRPDEACSCQRQEDLITAHLLLLSHLDFARRDYNNWNWHLNTLPCDGCQGFIGPNPSAFLDKRPGSETGSKERGAKIVE